MLTVTSGHKLVLASSSPRRREMLASLRLHFTVTSPDIDETPRTDESAESMVTRLASEKAAAAAREFPNDWLIAADTTVVIDDSILGKPVDDAEARQFLTQIQGREHRVLGGVCVLNKRLNISRTFLSSSKVRLRALSPAWIDGYVRTREPADKAGGYAVQGIGACLVEEVHGSYTNVVGLDLPKLVACLEELKVIEFG